MCFYYFSLVWVAELPPFGEELLTLLAPQGFWGSGEKGYLFSGSWGALLIILGELGSKHILLGI